MPESPNGEWVNDPRVVVQQLYQASITSPQTNWEEEITRTFENHISTSGENAVPLLSSDSASGSLVRHHVMVQDILDQEFYTKEFTAKCQGKCDVTGTGKYADVLRLSEGYEIDWDDNSSLKRDSRLVYYCVPVPGRNSWTCNDVINSGSDSASASAVMTTQTGIVPNIVEVSRKRGAPEDTMDTTEDTIKKSKEEAEGYNKESDGDGKKDTSKFQGLNMVLPTDSGMCCVALIYSADSSPFKINDIIEFTGILERVEVDTTSCDMDEEEVARFPPSSIVPRVHCVKVTACEHINPVLRSMSLSDQQDLLSQVGNIREEMVSLIKECVLGDPLTAEYLLLHLLSHVHTRRDDVMALGKFTVNLTKCPSKDSRFVECLSTLMSNVCETSFTMPLTISNFNNSVMIPKKDYSANRLKSGLLQLPKGIQIILDETVLEPGQLQPNGIENLKSLGNLISWQRLSYDFGFNYNIEFECDAKVLIVGEGKSLLPSEVVLPLKQMVDSPKYEEILSKMTSSHLDKFRSYLTLVRQIKYDEVGEEIQDKIEKDFVAERKENPTEVTGDTLHRLLVIARLYGISRGHVTLQLEDWESAKNLEKDRITRLSAS